MATPADKHDYLEESELFAGLTRKDLDVVEELTAMSRCERGRTFFAPNDRSGIVYFVKEGRVRLFREAADVKQLTVALLDRGTVFGECAVIGQSVAGLYAVADEECLLCTMPAENMKVIIDRIPRVAMNLVGIMGRRLQGAQELAEQIAHWPVDKRLAHAIADLDDRYGRATIDGRRIIDTKITQAEIADLIGSTRETVAALLGEMRRSEVIDMRGRQIVVNDRKALDEIVERR
jgi:CRP/FNR family transcriptional regulator